MADKDRLSVAVDDEQGVVDTDTETDHGGQGRGERRDVQEVSDEGDEQQATTESDDRGDDGQARRHNRTEGNEQDDDGNEESDGLAARGLLAGKLQQLTLNADGQGVALGTLDGVEDRHGFLRVHRRGVVLVDGERDRGVGDGSVRAHRREGSREGLQLLRAQNRSSDLGIDRATGRALTTDALPRGIEGVRHTRHGVLGGDLFEDRQHLRGGGLVNGRAGGWRPHDGGSTFNTAGVGAARAQQVRRNLGLGVRQVEGIVVLTGEADAQTGNRGECDEPGDEGDDGSANRPGGQDRHAAP